MSRDRLGPRAACDVQESEAARYKDREADIKKKRQQGASKYSLKDVRNTVKSWHFYFPFYLIHNVKLDSHREQSRATEECTLS